MELSFRMRLSVNECKNRKVSALASASSQEKKFSHPDKGNKIK
jgi:hypothetical protein